MRIFRFPRSVALLGAFWVVLGFVGLARAQVVTSFDQTITLPTPPRSSYSFTVTGCASSRAATLTTDRLSGVILGTVSWNGQEVFTRSDLAGHGPMTISHPITLNPSNDLFSSLVGQPGSVLRLRVTSPNTAPTISGSPAASVRPGESYSFIPTVTDPDLSCGAASDVLSFTIQNKPSWASFNTATGELSGTPAYLDAGIYSGIVIAVSDGTNLPVALPAFSIEVVQLGASAFIAADDGGTLEVTEPASPIYGASLVIPAGALPFDTVVWLVPSAAEIEPLHVGNYRVSPTAEVFPDGILLNVPAELRLPILPPGMDPLASGLAIGLSKSAGVVSAGDILDNDFSDGFGSLSTGHFSRFQINKTFVDETLSAVSIVNPPLSSGSYVARVGTADPIEVRARICGKDALGACISLNSAISANLNKYRIAVRFLNSNDPSNPYFISTDAGLVYVPDPLGQDDYFAFNATASSFPPAALQGDVSLSAVVHRARANPIQNGAFDCSTASNQCAPISVPPVGITVTNVNDPPAIGGTPGTWVSVGQSYSFAPVASDPDAPYGDTLTFQIQNQPAWTSFNAATGVLSGIPTEADVGTYGGITISVRDAGGLSASLSTFSITVLGDCAALVGTPQLSEANSQGDQANSAGYNDYYGADMHIAISSNGQYVAFVSPATNLVDPVIDDPDTNGQPDIFVRDLDTGRTARVSITSAGNQVSTLTQFGSFWIGQPSLSAEGRFVAFAANSPDFVGIPSNTATRVLVHDRDADEDLEFDNNRHSGGVKTIDVSAGTANPTPGGRWNAGNPTVSGDGRYVVFSVAWDNYPYTSSNHTDNIVVYDRDTDGDQVFDEPGEVSTVFLVSGTSIGLSAGKTMSLDARYVAFRGGAPNYADYVYDRDCDVPSGSDPCPILGNGIYDEPGNTRFIPFFIPTGTVQVGPPIISADGRYLTFISLWVNFFNYTTTYSPQWYDRDRDGNGIFDEMTTVNGQPGTGGGAFYTETDAGYLNPLEFPIAHLASLSAGPWIIYARGSGDRGVYVFDAQTGQSLRVSAGPGVIAASNFNMYPTISDDGKRIGFRSFANTTATDANGIEGLFGTSNPFYFCAAGEHLPTILGMPAGTITDGALYSFTPTAADLDGGDQLTFSIINRPSWAAFDPATGTLSGTPSSADAGTYSRIILSVHDSAGLAVSLSTFSITVVNVNDPPTISGTPSATATVGQFYSFVPTAADPDGDTLVFSIQGQPSWASFNTATGELSGTPARLDGGIYSGIEIFVSDGKNPPVSLPIFSIEVETQVVSPLTLTEPLEGETYPAGRFPLAGSYISDLPFIGANVTLDGTSILGNCLVLSTSGTLNHLSFSLSCFVPLLGPHALDVAFTDQDFAIWTETRHIFITDEPPSISGIPPAVANPGVLYDFAPTVSDVDLPFGDILTFEIENKPAWLHFSNQTGRLYGMPGKADVRTYPDIIIRVLDLFGMMAELPSFSIQVENIAHPLRISGTPPAVAAVGSLYSFTPTVSDPDLAPGGTLTYSITNPPSWAAFSTQTGTLSGTPAPSDAGTYSGIAILVSDSAGRSDALAPFSILVQDPSPAPTQAQVVSVSSEEVLGNDASTGPAISRDGTVVAFISAATNLVPNDTNRAPDIFVRTLSTGTTERASISSRGEQADLGAFSPSLSADGVRVAFVSLSTNLVPDDRNGFFDVFVRDRLSGVTKRLSVGPSGEEADGDCVSVALSADGHFVAFVSSATNLVADDTNGLPDVFVRDIDGETTQRVTIGASGDESLGLSPSTGLALSADGRYVLFDSDADNLVTGDTNQARDVFVRDLSLGQTQRVSLGNWSGEPNADSFAGTLSGDGALVSYASFADNLVAGDFNGVSDLFVFERSSGLAEIVSISSGGLPADGTSFGGAFSPDNRYVAFTSFAPNLGPLAAPAQSNVYVHDLVNGGTSAIAKNPNDSILNGSSTGIVLSDSSQAAFSSLANTLDEADTNLFEDVFAAPVVAAAARSKPSILRVSFLCTPGSEETRIEGRYFLNADLSALGTLLTYEALSPVSAAVTLDMASSATVLTDSLVVLSGAYAGLTDAALVSVKLENDTGLSKRFTVGACQGQGATPPTLSGTTPEEAFQYQAYSFTPTINGLAPGDVLTFGAVNLPGWLTLDTGTGEISGVPGALDEGLFQNIFLFAQDLLGGTAVLGPFAIAVRPFNNPPTISGTPDGAVLVDTFYEFVPVAGDADLPYGDFLEFTAENLPRWADFDPLSGRLSGVPTVFDVGMYPGILITVFDSALEQAQLGPFTISVLNQNHAPQISGTPVTYAVAGVPYHFVPVGTDVDGIWGDTVSFSGANIPSWATFDLGSGAISGVPQFSDVGTYPDISITAHDLQGAFATLAPFTIMVVDNNTTPQITGTPADTIVQDSPYYFRPLVVDPDVSRGDELTYTVQNLPLWAVFDNSSGTILGTPRLGDAGSYPGITILVTDLAEAQAALGPFSITVAPKRELQIYGTSPPEAQAGALYSFMPAVQSSSDVTVTYGASGLPPWAQLDADTGEISGTPPESAIGSTASGIQISASDGVANASLPEFSIEVVGPLVEPFVPSLQGPPLDTSVPTTLAAQSEFLYTGPSPVQIGVTPGTIEPVRVSVLRGRVFGKTIVPLENVRITVKDHPEFGETYTRVGGVFDMAVNGGGDLIVQYEKQDYLKVQRRVAAEWQDFTVLPDVILLQADPQVTAVDLSVGAAQVARSSPLVEGVPRQPTVIFPSGTQAELVLPDGSTQAISDFHVRLTENGIAGGESALPREFLGTGKVLYANAFTVPEEAFYGASHIRFAPPVAEYVENVFALPVGYPLFSSVFDADLSSWLEEEQTGRVVQVLGVDGFGRAELDLDGSGVIAGPDALAALGIGEDERFALASLYVPGQSLLRSILSRFSSTATSVCPFGLLPGGDGGTVSCAGQPNISPLLVGQTPVKDPQVNNPCQQSGSSTIECQNQVLGEILEVPGAPFDLHYSSDRVFGNAGARSMDIPITGPTLPTPQDGIELLGAGVHVVVAGRIFTAIWCCLDPDVPLPTGFTGRIEPNLTYHFEWDGYDVYGNRPVGPQPVKIRTHYWFKGSGSGSGGSGGSSTPPATIIGYGDAAVKVCTTGIAPTAFYSVSSKSSGGGFPAPPTATSGTFVGGTSTTDIPQYDFTATCYGTDPFTGAKHVYIETRSVLGSWDPRGLGLGGWTPSVHHTYDPVTRTLYKGDGSRVSASDDPANRILVRVPGSFLDPADIVAVPDGRLYICEGGKHRVLRVAPDTGVKTVYAGGNGPGYSGDGGAAIAAKLNHPEGIALDRAGNLYIADTDNYRIRKVSKAGIITTVAGTGSKGLLFLNANLLYTATNVSFPHPPRRLEFDRAGNLLIVAAVDPDSYFTWDRSQYLLSPDGKMKVTTGLGRHGFAVGQDGSLYIFSFNVGTYGVGRSSDTTTSGSSSSGGGSFSFAVASSPSPTSTPTAYSVKRTFLNRTYPDRSMLVAGTFASVDLDEAIANKEFKDYSSGTAVSTGPILDGARDVAVAPDGSLVIADTGHRRVRLVTQDEVIHRIAGSCTAQDPTTCPHDLAGLGGAATGVNIGKPVALTYAPNGDLYILDGENGALLRLTSKMGAYTGGNINLVSEDGSELYAFDGSGRHLATRDTLTGASIFSFGYDLQGRLASITDRNGLITTIAHTSVAPPLFKKSGTIITAPGGQKSQLRPATKKAYASSFANPAGETWQASYGGGGKEGLLLSFTTPVGAQGGGPSKYTYDASGRLIRAQEPPFSASQGFKDITRTVSTSGSDFSVAMTTAEGRTTTYGVSQNPWTGEARANIFPDGTESSSFQASDGAQVVLLPDHTRIESALAPDPRFGWQAPFASKQTISTPGGRKLSIDMTRRAFSPNQADPFALSDRMDSVSVNGETYWSGFTRWPTIGGGIFGHTTPENRFGSVIIDRAHRVLGAGFGKLAPVSFVYDSRGRLIKATRTRGNEIRQYALSYDAKDRLSTVLDPEGNALTYGYDGADRVTSVSVNGTATVFDVRADGEVIGITPPGKPRHILGKDVVGNFVLYAPPPPDPNSSGIIGRMRMFHYNRDRQLMEITMSGDPVPGQTNAYYANTIFFYYNSNGKLDHVSLNDYPYTVEDSFHDYFDDGVNHTGQLSTITGPVTPAGTALLSYTYDGFLPLTETFDTPEVRATVARTYDDNFRLKTLSAYPPSCDSVCQTAAGPQVVYTYDRDGLVTGAGALAVTRYAATGLEDTTTLGGITTKKTYNGFGELSSSEASGALYGLLYRTLYKRDKLGRITEKQESIRNPPGSLFTMDDHVFHYIYDPLGRLEEVYRDGVLLSHFVYDGNGNRLAETVGGNVGVYDDQDRIHYWGPVSGTGGRAYTWSNSDRLTATSGPEGVTNYQFNLLGTLNHVDLPSGDTLDFPHDGRQRRLERIRTNAANTTFDGHAYLYEGQLRVISYNTIFPGQSTYNGGPVRAVFGTMPHSPDYVVAATPGGPNYRIISDHLGSPRLVVNSVTGAIVHRIDYDAFGKITNEWVTSTDSVYSTLFKIPYGFAGGIREPSTGLIHFGARDLDPETGRWVQRDPILFGGGDTNLFGYVMADPINFIDPEGLLFGGTVNAGEAYGEESAQYWADLYFQTENPLYAGLGGLASLWTCGTSDVTALTLGGGVAIRIFGPFPTAGLGRLGRLRQYFRIDPPHHQKPWHIHWPW